MPGTFPESLALDSIAVMLGHDPFALFAELSRAEANARPKQRAAMAAALAGSLTVAAQTAALGYVLDPDARVADVALEAMADAARRRPLARSQIARLRRLLPWLPADRRKAAEVALDEIGPGEAVADPPPATPRRVMSSLCDGGGAWSLFVVAKRGTSHAMVSILAKTGRGVIDTMVDGRIARADADAMLRRAGGAMELRPTSVASATRRLAHALSENAAAGTLPPFGLLLCCELLGIAPPPPQAVAPAELAAELLTGLRPEETNADASGAAQRAWPGLVDRHPIMASWIESEDETGLRRLRAAYGNLDARAQVVLDELLPARRGFWAAQCAWSAAALREAARPGQADWRHLALIARDLAGTGPLSDMMFALYLAATTAAAAGKGKKGRR